MSLKFKLIKSYYKTFSAISPTKAGYSAFNLFQTTQNKNIRERELPFFERSEEFRVPFKDEDLYCYKRGNEQNPWILLVHGWNSNIASMHAIAEGLIQNGYYVIGLNLPAHGPSKLKKTNMERCSKALIALLDHLNPNKPLSIVSHSFGSAVVSYTLTQKNIAINQLIYLTCPNSLGEVFKDFSHQIGLNNAAHSHLVQLAENILGQKIEHLVVSNLLHKSNFQELTLIHDEYDKVISIKDAQKIQQTNPKSKLISMQNIGHYRMLWNSELIDLIVNQLNSSYAKHEMEEPVLAAFN